MATHSTLIGGSTADRLLNCPGSYQLIQKIPDQVEVASEYANYGTAMHACMDHLMSLYADDDTLPDKSTLVAAALNSVGFRFFDRELDNVHIEESILPAIEALYELLDIYGEGYRVVANELKVKFPGVPSAFGTADLLLANDKTVLMVDWKFGAGVPVRAVTTDQFGEKVNPQLLFYFAGAMEEFPTLFRGKRFAVAIIQPRTDVRFTHTAITRAEVKMFVEDVEAAIVLAIGKNPPLLTGDHCRWCPARPHCPAHTEPLFELIGLEIMPAQLKAAAGVDDGSYGEFLAKAKVLADLAAQYKKQVDDAVHSYLENGGTVPGWKLKLKTKLRQWTDETTIAGWMKSEGFEDHEIWQTKLQTFAVADKAAKRHGVKIPDEFRVAPATDETVIAPESDKAPAIDRNQAALEFQDALKSLLPGA